jgi:hypothetical protein
MRSVIRDARKLYDIFAVLGLDSTKRSIVCPMPQHIHQNYTPSFSIFTKPDGTQYFRCHGSCNLDGDVIDLTGYLRISNYDPHDGEMVKRAIALLQSGYQVSPPKVKKARIARLPYETIRNMPEPDNEVLAYALEKRGLTDNTLHQFGVKMYENTGRKYMAIPTFHFGELVGIKLRNVRSTGKHDRFLLYPGSTTGLFGYSKVFANSAPVLIVKAEIPVMLLYQYGIHACGPSGSENVNRAELFKPLAWAVKRVVVKDNDRNPKVRAKMDEYAAQRAKAFHAELKAPPDTVKDIDEWILRDGEEAIETIKGWLR